jgi:hypothetical protein
MTSTDIEFKNARKIVSIMAAETTTLPQQPSKRPEGDTWACTLAMEATCRCFAESHTASTRRAVCRIASLSKEHLPALLGVEVIY